MKIRKIEVATEDDRGTISDILYKDNINHVAVITSKKGALRGNHYHKETTQYIFMNEGCLRYWYADIGSDDVQSILVERGWLVETPPREIHALECVTDSIFTVFSRVGGVVLFSSHYSKTSTMKLNKINLHYFHASFV